MPNLFHSHLPHHPLLLSLWPTGRTRKEEVERLGVYSFKVKCIILIMLLNTEHVQKPRNKIGNTLKSDLLYPNLVLIHCPSHSRTTQSPLPGLHWPLRSQEQMFPLVPRITSLPLSFSHQWLLTMARPGTSRAHHRKSLHSGENSWKNLIFGAVGRWSTKE